MELYWWCEGAFCDNPGWSQPGYPTGPVKPWTYKNRWDFWHTHYCKFRFVVRGKGFSDTIQILPGRWINLFGWQWLDTYWGEKTATTTTEDRVLKVVEATMPADTANWFYSNNALIGKVNYGLAIKNNQGAGQWFYTNESTHTNNTWEVK